MKNKKILTLISCIICINVFILTLGKIEVINPITYNNPIQEFFYQIGISLKNINFKTIIIFILLYYFIYNSLYNNKINKKSLYISILLSIITIIGISYQVEESIKKAIFLNYITIYKAIVTFIGYLIIYYSIIEQIKKIKLNNIYLPNNKIEKIWNKHPIIITSLILIICWLPYIIIFYPGGATGDTTDSIFQFFHSKYSWTKDTINLINPNIYINKHHSVLFTILIGNFIKLGNMIGSNNIGFFLYVLFQITILIIIFNYIFIYLKKIKTPFWIILLFLLYFSLSPVIVKFSVTAIKDTLSAALTCLYVIYLHQIINNYKEFLSNKRKIVLLIITMILVMMFRNNGIYTIILSFPFLLFINKKKKKLLSILSLSLVIFISYNSILLPSLGISNGSIKEVLTVPIMQIARVGKYHMKSFPDNEIKKLNKIFDFELSPVTYNPNLADNTKDSYKKNNTNKEVHYLFKIWLKYLKKYPDIYIESFLNSTYGYFYPAYNECKEIKVYKDYMMYEQKDVIFKKIKKLENSTETFNYILSNINKIPIIILFNNVGLINIILLATILNIIKKKEYKYIIVLMPLISVVLMCLLSPVNGSYRYMLPIYYSMPIIISILYTIGGKEND